jgi:transglutaminase-like putative cysteine protease
MTAVSWGELYRGTNHDRFQRPGGLIGTLRDTERWLNLLLLFVALMAMSNSLERANWVDEMPSLTAAAIFGLASGWVLAQIPLHSWLLQIVGMTVGFAWVFAIVMINMELADPLLESGVRARWSELWLRLRDWGTALVEGGSSSDPLPFVMILVFGTWAVSYLASWSVVRWRNAWVALIPPGFVLLTNISYLPGQPSMQFVIFLFAAVLLVLQLHFARALVRWRHDRVTLPSLMSMEVTFAGVWIALALIISAWLVPTANNWGPAADLWGRAIAPVTDRADGLGRVFFGVSAKRDIPIHNFGSVLPLRGKVSLSSDPLMEVSADEIGNLRGAVYDEYTGTGWRISDATAQPLLGTTVEGAEFGTPLSQAQLRRPVRVEILVVGPVPDRRLLAFGDPIASDVPGSLLFGAGDVIGVAPEDRLEEGDTYTTVGTVSAATIETLLASPITYPGVIVDRYTQLPDDLPSEVRALAANLSEGMHPFAAARTIEQHLRANYAYSTDIEDTPPLRDSVDYFLFDSQVGYFDQHATAMAVMLRTLGIPTRLSAGFVVELDALDDITKTYVISEKDAWAWPEVYFTGLGWVEFNPTPGRSLIARPGDDTTLRDLLATGSLAHFPFDEDLALLELEELFALQTKGLDLDAFNDLNSGSGVGAIVVRLLTMLMLAAAVLFAAGIGFRFAWGYPLRALDPAQRRWTKLQRLAAWMGINPRVTRTPLEWARETAGQVGETPGFEAIARDYTRARYGAGTDERSEEETTVLDKHYRQARNQLWRHLTRRLLPTQGRASAVAESATARRHRV